MGRLGGGVLVVVVLRWAFGVGEGEGHVSGGVKAAQDWYQTLSSRSLKVNRAMARSPDQAVEIGFL